MLQGPDEFPSADYAGKPHQRALQKVLCIIEPVLSGRRESFSNDLDASSGLKGRMSLQVLSACFLA